MDTWRDRARPIIFEVIEQVGKEDMKSLRKALRDAYPWGERKYHPYKIWLDEIRVQLGEKTTQKKEIQGQMEMPWTHADTPRRKGKKGRVTG